MFLTVEKGIKDTIIATLGRAVREVETHPGRWGKEVITQMLSNAPGVYVGFSTGSYKDSGGDVLQSQWHVYVVARSLNGKTEAGVYQLIERLLPALHGLDLDQSDALRFQRVKNLFSFAEAKHGFSCYEMVFELPMNWPDLIDASALDDWLRYTADHYDPNDPTHIMATDTVEIPQE